MKIINLTNHINWPQKKKTITLFYILNIFRGVDWFQRLSLYPKIIYFVIF